MTNPWPTILVWCLAIDTACVLAIVWAVRAVT
jgi:hypothetical protein